MATAVENVQTQSELDDFDMDELRRLARLEFYASLRRRAPMRLISIPSYVKAVKRQLRLTSGNQARQVLATIEGYKDWPALTAAMLRQVEWTDNQRGLCPTNEGSAPKGVNHGIRHAYKENQRETGNRSSNGFNPTRHSRGPSHYGRDLS